MVTSVASATTTTASNAGQSVITALNAGNGMNITELATNLTAAEKAPAQNIIDTKKAALSAQVSSIGKIMSTVDSFTSSLAALGDPNTFQRTPKSSDDTKVQVEFLDGAVPPSFSGSVNVTALASESTVTFPPISNINASLTGSDSRRTLTLYAGTAGAPGPATKTIDLSTFNTLPKLRDAINGISGMSAAILQGGTAAAPQYYLTVKSATGAANQFFSTITNDSGAAVTTGGGLTTGSGYSAKPGSDATITVDGISVNSATNTFDNVIAGVRLTATNLTGTSPVTVTSETDTTALTNAITTMVGGFNTMIQTINTEANFDPDKTKRGGLAGDTGAAALIRQLRSFTTQPIAGYDDKTRSFSELGISTNRDGTLSLDANAFVKKLKADPTGVEAILASRRSTSDTSVKFGSASSATPTGVYTVATDGASNWSINGTGGVLDSGLLTGSSGSKAAGLSVILSSDLTSHASSGYTAKIYYSKGLLERFSDMLASVKDSNSALQSETTTANASLKQLDTDQTKLDTKMTAVQQRYMTQFTAMQTFLNQSKDTQSSLTTFMTSWTAGLKSA